MDRQAQLDKLASILKDYSNRKRTDTFLKSIEKHRAPNAEMFNLYLEQFSNYGNVNEMQRIELPFNGDMFDEFIPPHEIFSTEKPPFKPFVICFDGEYNIASDPNDLEAKNTIKQDTTVVIIVDLDDNMRGHIIPFYKVDPDTTFMAPNNAMTITGLEGDDFEIEVWARSYLNEPVPEYQKEEIRQALCIVGDTILFMNNPPEQAVRQHHPSLFKQSRRKKKRKPPLPDHYVIDLSRVAGTAVHADGKTGTHRSPRVHYRRGHWRHYADHKVWIKPVIVGSGRQVKHSYRVKKRDE